MQNICICEMNVKSVGITCDPHGNAWEIIQGVTDKNAFILIGNRTHTLQLF
jgi:hypothetical protein